VRSRRRRRPSRHGLGFWTPLRPTASCSLTLPVPVLSLGRPAVAGGHGSSEPRRGAARRAQPRLRAAQGRRGEPQPGKLPSHLQGPGPSALLLSENPVHTHSHCLIAARDLRSPVIPRALLRARAEILRRARFPQGVLWVSTPGLFLIGTGFVSGFELSCSVLVQAGRLIIVTAAMVIWWYRRGPCRSGMSC
jgi:hypothetical protein